MLIVSNENRFFHLRSFSESLKKYNIDSKLIHDLDFTNRFLDFNINRRRRKDGNLKEILEEYKPDLVLLDRLSGVASEIIKRKIPYCILIRGNFWEESKWAKKTIYSSPIKKLSFFKNQRFAEMCFNNASLLLPISKYLENVTKEKFPQKKIILFYADGRNPSEWKSTTVMKLKHPCVGLIQGMNVWGKTKEILTLTKVMNELPNVTFYLAGDGIYENEIIPKLKKFKNFIWLNKLEYPNEIKKFFSEIDIYLLLTGLEGLGQTIIEALLMKKLVIATNVGGVPELINNETGFLVKEKNHEEIIEKIKYSLDNPMEIANMKINGRKMMEENFSWDEIAKKFKSIIDENFENLK